MKTIIKQSITLELTHEEAVWLKNIVQNPLHDIERLEDENATDRSMRETFFKALGVVYA